MYGYVIINEEKLTREQSDRYRAYYCGLCRALGNRHGSCGKLTLSYDLTFLSMLLAALYEPEEENGSSRCMLHPAQPHPWVSTEFDQYAADMSVLLTCCRCEDDWKDDHKYTAIMLKHALSRQFAEVSEKYPRQAVAVSHSLQQLARLEEAQSCDLDEVSGCFGLMLSAVFDVKNDEWSVPLREMGFSLGKFIYLMDAYDDLEKDIKKGHYNPLRQLSLLPEYEERIHEILTMLMAQCAAAFERLPVLRDAEILRNVLYSGVWTRYAQIKGMKEKKASQKGSQDERPV